MKRLLAVLALVVLPVLPAQAAATTPDAYLNEVAANLGDTGVWVDPDVDELTSTEVAQLNAAAKNAAAPIRIAVVPASKLKNSEYGSLAWDGEEIADQLYDRVGVEGVYAVLVDASSQSKGRGFHAVQRADHGPTYHVEDAVDSAVDCCAPNYERMLERFILRAQVVDKPWYIDIAPWAGGIGGVFGLWWGIVTLGARRARRSDEKAHLSVVSPMLNEEIIALSQQVSQLPATSEPQQAKLSKDVLDTVEKARHRLDAAKGDADIEAVTTLLGSARYGLVCIDAVRAGQPIPEPTPPCFFDPRHGPSSAEVEWQPEGGTTRKVDVCAACKQRDEAGEQPQIRMVTLWRDAKPYWTFGEELAAYIDGYWSQGDGRRWWYPEENTRRAGERMRSRWASRRAGARFGRWRDDVGTSISSWESSRSSSSDGDSGWSSGSSRRSYSSRTRSSGGGSSRRSSRRSGGSRGF
ncbi:hypothetical protein GCM10009745_06290 [Kribbella yunnanensis]|uniref:TPM domain-containing protein n=1 Tax=Kribbella yunnanensis TaxID=190194 RepID=A0ABN2G7P0_9ACTN